jgi:hypothetical protein
VAIANLENEGVDGMYELPQTIKKEVKRKNFNTLFSR